MYQEPIKVKKGDVWFLVKRTFPEYRGRTFRLSPAESVTLHDVNWGDGSRNSYRITPLTLDDVTAISIPSPAPWNNPYEGAKMAIHPGFAVVEHSIFCGQDMGIRVHVHPVDLARGFLNIRL